MVCKTGQNFSFLIFIPLFAVFITACQTTHTPVQSSLSPSMNIEQPSRVTLKSGDVVEIKFAYASQFNESQAVRPDGKIELQLIGEVVAQGKTPTELREELVKLYSTQLKHPELAVIVKSFFERRVYVGGEVNKPGPIDIPGEMTALEAIMHAGGFNLEKAEVRNVIVVRKQDGRLVGTLLDFKMPLRARKPSRSTCSQETLFTYREPALRMRINGYNSTFINSCLLSALAPAYFKICDFDWVGLRKLRSIDLWESNDG